MQFAIYLVESDGGLCVPGLFRANQHATNMVVDWLKIKLGTNSLPLLSMSSYVSSLFPAIKMRHVRPLNLWKTAVQIPHTSNPYKYFTVGCM